MKIQDSTMEVKVAVLFNGIQSNVLTTVEDGRMYSDLLS
jgi:hypothetical protein